MSIFTILCVDDTLENLYSYEALLSKFVNVKVLRTTSGAEALKMSLREKVDLILLDVQMPEMDGYEIASLLKNNPLTQKIPIIFITAVFKEEKFVDKGFNLGAVDYMTKPIHENALLNRIELYLDVFFQKEKAEKNLEMFSNIAYGIGDGVYVLNGKGEIVFINDMALYMLGYSKEELIGKIARDIIYFHDKFMTNASQDEHQILQVFQTKEITKIEGGFLVKKDTSLLPVTTIATPIVKNNLVTNVVSLFHDASQELKSRRASEKKIRAQNEMLVSLAESLDKRDPYMAGHTRRVSEYCRMIAQSMGYSKDKVDLLVDAANLHDVGKIAIPDSILCKDGVFDAGEYETMKLHLSNGYNLIKNIPSYREVAEIMRHHHERYDGKGYPQGLAGDAIPPLARIMIVADSFDALTTNRVYKHSKSVEDALKEIKALRGIKFHPEVVDAAIKALKDVTIDRTTI